jgi:hypothetical protein
VKRNDIYGFYILFRITRNLSILINSLCIIYSLFPTVYVYSVTMKDVYRTLITGVPVVIHGKAG